jgi:hypothetical protein
MKLLNRLRIISGFLLTVFTACNLGLQQNTVFGQDRLTPDEELQIRTVLEKGGTVVRPEKDGRPGQVFELDGDRVVIRDLRENENLDTVISGRLFQQMEHGARERILQRRSENPLTARILMFLLQRGVEPSNIDLTSTQLSHLKNMLDDFESKRQEIEQKAKAVDEKRAPSSISQKNRELQQNFVLELNQKLVGFQHKEIEGWTPENLGIVKLLTETPIGTALELSEEQQAKIRREAELVVQDLRSDLDKVLNSVKTSRERIKSLLDESLTNEQRQDLEQLYEFEIEQFLRVRSLRIFLQYRDLEYSSDKQLDIPKLLGLVGDD